MPNDPAKELDENFTTNLRAARIDAGWTQVEMASKLQQAGLSNFHPTTVSRVEKGERTVSMGEATAISRVLRRSLDDLTAPPVEYQRARRLARILDRIGTEHEWALRHVKKLLKYRQALWLHLWEVDYSDEQKSSALEILGRFNPVNLVEDALQDIERERQKPRNEDAGASIPDLMAELRKSVQVAKARRETMHGQHPEET